MWHKILSYKKEVSIIAFLTACFGGLGYFIDAKIIEKNQPFQQRVIKELRILSEQNIRLNDKVDNVQEKVTNTNNYVNGTLRIEVKKIAETKVDKTDFYNQNHEMDNRLDSLEIGKDIRQNIKQK